MKKIGIIVATFALPLLASAQITTDVSNVNGVIRFISSALNAILPLIIALSVVYFIWGIFRFVMAGDDEAKAAAKDKIIYGVVGLFVMISVWGLVNILVNTFGLDRTNRGNEVKNQLPTLP